MKNLPYILATFVFGIIFFIYLIFNSNLPFQFKDQAKFLQYVDFGIADGSLLGGITFFNVNFYTPADENKKTDSQLTASNLNFQMEKGLPTVLGKGIFFRHIRAYNGMVDLGPEGYDRYELFKKSLPESIINFPSMSLQELSLKKFTLTNLKFFPDLKIDDLLLTGLVIEKDRFSLTKLKVNSNVVDINIEKPKEIFFIEDELSFTGVLKPTFFESLLVPTLLKGNVYVSKGKFEYEVYVFNNSLRILYVKDLEEVDIDDLNTEEYIKNIFPIKNLKIKIRKNPETKELETNFGHFTVGSAKFEFAPGPFRYKNGDLIFVATAKIKGKTIHAEIYPFKFNKLFRYSIRLKSPDKLSMSQILSLILYNKHLKDIDLAEIAVLNKKKLLLAL
jgi:hypothetical protein